MQTLFPSVLFVGAGVAHFAWPGVFVRIVPPYLPRPLLLCAVLPVHVHMARVYVAACRPLG